jgi:predicted 2-oxoglutarate/Fe(II)-dependent dioxygenase YbiX
MQQQMPSIRNLSQRAFSIDGLLTYSECDELIALAENSGFSSAGVRTVDGQKPMLNVRNNERVMVESQTWVALLWDRLGLAGLPELDVQKAQGLPKDLRFYKYSAGQRFKMHKDGPWHEGGMTSKLTFLVYLNESFAGGTTDFRDFNVKPKTGSALLFIHDTWHEGAAVESGVKYVLRSDVLYASEGG